MDMEASTQAVELLEKEIVRIKARRGKTKNKAIAVYRPRDFNIRGFSDFKVPCPWWC